MRHRGPAGSPLRDQIAAAAAELFYRHGITAVGVDRIADTAGVTKRTMYRYYRTKDELIAASLRRAPFIAFPKDGDPLERILGAFRAMEQFLATSDYRGCPYIFYAAELTERSHPARAVIEERLRGRRAWFRARAAEAGLHDPETVAEQLDVLFDGALASGAKRSDLVAAQTALGMVEMVIAHAKQRPIRRAS